MESLGVLAGGVAHDFNNLLVGIMGNASLALDMLPESSPLAPLLDDVVLASQKAADLTRQMLAYAGKGRFLSEPTDLSSLVQDIAGLVRTSISKKVTLTLNLEPDLPLIEADPTQLQQLVMNLLINGAEAIGDKQGTVTVTTGSRDIEAGTGGGSFSSAAAEELEAGHYVFLQVRDSGCGMDEATRSRMFEPFFTTKFTCLRSCVPLWLTVRLVSRRPRARSRPGGQQLWGIFSWWMTRRLFAARRRMLWSATAFRFCSPRMGSGPPTFSRACRIRSTWFCSI
jgi:signal transduction histidine kinase